MQDQAAQPPTLRDIFAATGGTVIGRDHLDLTKPNQDALFIVHEPQCIVAVVADGCSSSAHPEVGARLFARMAARRLAQRSRDGGPPFWNASRQDLVHWMAEIVGMLGGDGPKRGRDVHDLFNFTLVAAVITPQFTEIAAIGDGYASINGERLAIARNEDQEPGYLSYALSGDADLQESARWQVLATRITAEVDTVIVGSDGLCDLAACATETPPGSTWPAGTPEQFVQGAAFAKNPDAIRRRLVALQGGLAAPGSGHHGLRGGILPDDTTVVAIRRREPLQAKPAAPATGGGA